MKTTNVRLEVGSDVEEGRKAANLLRKAGYEVVVVPLSDITVLRIGNYPLEYNGIKGIKRFMKDYPCQS